MIEQLTEQNSGKAIEQILVNVTEQVRVMTEQMIKTLIEKKVEQMKKINKVYRMTGEV